MTGFDDKRINHPVAETTAKTSYINIAKEKCGLTRATYHKDREFTDYG